MTKKSAANAAKSDPDKVLQLTTEPGEADGTRLAKLGLDPAANAMTTARLFTKGTFGELAITALYEEMGKAVAAAKRGDLSRQRAMLAGQSFALNAIFTEMARRAALNMGEYVQTSERYMRLALKAQAQSRATVEALERLIGGREQTVKHVHVDNRGGQAVIADAVHTGGGGFRENDEQPHATGAAGASAALPCPDPIGDGVPIPSGEREAALSDARRV
jgi:hypothetical protein